MAYEVNDRVRRIEPEGDNNNHTTTATVIEVDEGILGLNYDELDDPDVIHGWWPESAVTPHEGSENV